MGLSVCAGKVRVLHAARCSFKSLESSSLHTVVTFPNPSHMTDTERQDITDPTPAAARKISSQKGKARFLQFLALTLPLESKHKSHRLGIS